MVRLIHVWYHITDDMKILFEIKPTAAPIEEYETFAPDACLALYNEKPAIAGYTVLHISSTANGGGVAELLRSQVPLERSLGIDARWFVMGAPADFFRATKKIHNLLQGAHHDPLSVEEMRLYEDTNRALGHELNELLGEGADAVFIHDPHPLHSIEYIDRAIPSFLRIHIDLSRPDPEMIEFLRASILKYTAVVFSHTSFVPSWLTAPGAARIIMPAIDPFTDKNRPLGDSAALAASVGVDMGKPRITQVSRFDQWKDPTGVIEAYLHAREFVPGLQLILAGSHADDDPEGVSVYEAARRFASRDPRIIFYTEQNDLVINAIRTESDIVIQKSIREGFGLTVTEAMWKGKAVIGGDTAGIRSQITDGENGFIASSPSDAASAIVRLYDDPLLRREIGAQARKTVLSSFLMPRFISDHVVLYREVAR